jgi:hypothetical protein
VTEGGREMRRGNPCSQCEKKKACKRKYPLESSQANANPFDRKKDGKCLIIQERWNNSLPKVQDPEREVQDKTTEEGKRDEEIPENKILP